MRGEENEQEKKEENENKRDIGRGIEADMRYAKKTEGREAKVLRKRMRLPSKKGETVKRVI